MFSHSNQCCGISRLTLVVLYLAVVLTCVAAFAQEANSQAAPPEGPAIEIPTAPVKLDGETLFGFAASPPILPTSERN